MSTLGWALTLLGVLAGLAVGSFTNVVIDRLPVPRTEPNEHGEWWDLRPWSEVLGGTSRCSSCGHRIRPRDEVPIVSWVRLRGRCRSCRAAIPAYHPVVEAAVPLLGLLFVAALGRTWLLLVLLPLIPVGLAVAAIDLRTRLVPTRLVWPTFGAVVVLSVVAVALDGDPRALRGAAIGSLVLAGPLAVIWWFVPAGMGFGDVRLAVLLGWVLGVLVGGPLTSVAFMAVLCLGLSAVLGLLLAVVVLGVRHRRAEVPFGPALVAASFACVAAADPLLAAIGGFPH